MQERYSEEEREILFSLNYNRFQRILDERNWFKLQQEFKNPLSESFLIWREVEETGSERWLLVDFRRHSTYSINRGELISDNTETPLVHVSEFPNLEDQLKTTSAICHRLQMDHQTSYGPQGTREGFILLLLKLNVGSFYVDGLKRSELSGSKFDFESVHPDVSVVHGMFREILTSDYDDLINLSDAEIETLRTYLPQFYEKAQDIENFDISGDNPKDKHADLLKEISDFCGNAKSVLTPTITYLRSEEIKQYESQLKSTLDTAVEKFENETDRAKKINNDNEEKQQTLNELILKQENQLLETSMKPYAKMFAEQANAHQKNARFWFKVAIGLNIAFAILFGWLISALAPAGSDLPLVLQNLLTKGFFLSLVYLLLNRVIKNYTAEKHLEIVNLHRKNALDTFQEFADASGENRETRDQVLLAATHAIFDTNQSGYLSVKTGRSESASPIQNMFRAVIPGKNE